MLNRHNNICVVISNNLFLYFGVKGMKLYDSVHHVNFHEEFDDNVFSGQKHIYVIVDGNIFYDANWTAYHSLVQHEGITLIWLTIGKHWNLFPYTKQNSFKLHIKSTLTEMKNHIKLIMKSLNTPKLFSITRTMIPLKKRAIVREVLIGTNINAIALSRSRPLKSVYAYRHFIVSIFGFSSAYHLAFIYLRNSYYLDKTGVN